MTRGSKKRLIERIKSLLIVLLSCSAVLLVLRTQAVILGTGGETEPYPSGEEGTSSSQDTAAAARPMRMAAAIQRGSEVVRYGVQYDQESTDTLFQHSYSLLLEALSSAGQPRVIQEEDWRRALTAAPGLYFDWQGEIPLAVLSQWLSVDNQALTGTVRRMVLTAENEQMLLYYWDVSTDQGYVCSSDVISSDRITEVVGTLQENGALFAFEAEEYAALSPYTMVLTQPPMPTVYSGVNPLADEDSRRTLQEQLGFSENAISYNAAGEQVIRSRNDTLHITEDGIVMYEASAEGSDRYHLAGTGIYDAVEGCRQLVQQTLGLSCGEASLYLISAEETGDGGWQVKFGYCLDGVQVRLDEEGWAASFVVEQGQITDFQLRFRSYTDSGTTTVVLPERQAAAAMEAMGHAGEELLLVYLDSGSDELVSASWAAASQLSTGR